jgi:hypothetical protein
MISKLSSPITVTLKLFSGIDKQLTQGTYDPEKGIRLDLPKGTRLKKALKIIGLTDLSMNIYYKNGVRISTWNKLADGDEVSCLKASGGG